MAKGKLSSGDRKGLVSYIKMLNAHGEDSDEHRQFLKDHRSDKKLMQLCHTMLILRHGMADGLLPLDHYSPRERRRVRRMLQRLHAKRISERLFGLSK